jgi:predicted RNA methylase
MKIAEDILNILAECRTEENVLYLPGTQLERKTYEAVNKVLTNIGGKWSRKEKGHVFDYEPGEALENLVLTGETEDMKKKFQFFPTPRPVAEMMCDMAELGELTDIDFILEPSCGKGDLADVIYERCQNLICNELNEEMKKYLDKKPYKVCFGDFLTVKDDVCGHERIIMNPPFARQQDIDHILKAYSLLSYDGILVSIASTSWEWRTNAKSVEFREWLSEVCAEITGVEAGAFKESGTAIPTKIIKIKKRKK